MDTYIELTKYNKELENSLNKTCSGELVFRFFGLFMCVYSFSAC